jgi:hypothetical protein
MQETAGNTICLRALLQCLLRQGAFLIVFPVPNHAKGAFQSLIWGQNAPGGYYHEEKHDP